MKHVGILTFQNTLNFGAMLQCYALFETIEKLGYGPEVIDYHCPKVESREGLAFDGSARSLAKLVLRRRKAKRFSEFKACISFSPRCDRASIANVCGRYDYVVVGSDQVWNLDCTGADPSFFLDFLVESSRKKSYAASIGTTSFDQQGLPCGAWLNDFSSLLVRESAAARAIGEIVSNDVRPRVVLDPTLLLTDDEWGGISHPPAGLKSGNYVLVYAISEYEKTLEAARILAAQRGCEIVQIQQYGMRHTPGVINMRNLGPAEYVWLFDNAEATIVSSFHGMCFSLIFEKEFFFATDSGSSGKQSRLLDLLASLGIQGRSVDDYLAKAEQPVNYECVRHRLEGLRTQSVNELANALS